MSHARTRVSVLRGLLLFAAAAGLLSSPGWSYAADRTVVGELWSEIGRASCRERVYSNV